MMIFNDDDDHNHSIGSAPEVVTSKRTASRNTPNSVGANSSSMRQSSSRPNVVALQFSDRIVKGAVGCLRKEPMANSDVAPSLDTVKVCKVVSPVRSALKMPMTKGA